MRRFLVIYFWLFRSRNNVGIAELIRFLIKPRVRQIANEFIKDISTTEGNFVVSFKGLNHNLYWPKEYPIDGIYQVTSETFDKSDWHYYQKEHTEVLTDEVILDVGAAEGLFLLSVIDTCKKVIVVEPNDLFFNSLKETFKFCKDKVEFFNVAVGSENGEIMFDESSLSGKIERAKSGGRLKKINTIDSLIPENTPFTYLKADVEGYELEMLKGAKNSIKKNRPKIAITCYHTENNANEMIEFIKSVVPEYEYYVKGVFHETGKPVMIHFWIPQ